MPSSRQLAAIMFTDIVGYTALMGEDEQNAFELLKRNRQLQKSLIEQYTGKWIKEFGDGILASFPTATDAVQCAIYIQQSCNNIPDLKLRIGVHLGDVVFEDNDVFGDGVNIASRIQTLAPVGGIWISEPVYYNVANKKDINTKFIRAELLKNVKEPVRIYEVIINIGEKEQQKGSVFEKIAGKTIHEKSIAVLPFVDMSPAHDQEYFSEGIAEEIINSLAHLKNLKVAGRTSSAQFKGKNIDLQEVGEKLHVRTVLEGSVRKQGNRLRVTAQLIDLEDGFHLWSERYDRDMDDIFAIQDEIALAITEQLKITLLEKDREIIIKTSTQNTEAYELYLKGRFYINRRGGSIPTALHFFKNAIDADPNYALAYAGYAIANIYFAFYSFVPGSKVMKEVKQAITTAIGLDDSLAEAYLSLAQYYACLELNWNEAQKNYIKSVEINPGYAQGHSIYGMVYFAFIRGKFDEAEKHGRTGIRLEPLSAIDHADFAWALYAAQKFDEALVVAKTGIELDANSFLSQRVAGLCYIALGRYEEAINTFRFLIEISNSNQQAVNGLIWAYSSGRNFEKAKILFDELKQRSTKEYIAGTYFGISAAWLGDMDTAFNYLENAYTDHDPALVNLKYALPVPASLRNDPRFQNLLDKIGFPK